MGCLELISRIWSNGRGRPVLLIWISETQRGARFAREFETCQLRRTRIDILGEREDLKSAPEHFGVQQRLEGAFGFGRIR